MFAPSSVTSFKLPSSNGNDLVLLYWDIGRDIVEKQTNAAWGDAVVERFLTFSLPCSANTCIANSTTSSCIFKAYEKS